MLFVGGTLFTRKKLLIINLENYYLASNSSCTKYIGGGACIFVMSDLQFNTLDVSHFCIE